MSYSDMCDWIRDWLFIIELVGQLYASYVLIYCANVVFFFFKQKTAYEIVSRDWSSDVCSSDLLLKVLQV